MSEKLRSVNTKFWDDTFISDLNPSEKLLFLYLLTNSLANILGIYEITIKRISYDTGLTKETIAKGLESFAKGRKAFHTDDNYIIMPNWLKNQRLNTNMKVAVAKEFNALPKHIKDSILSNGSEALPNDSEGFRRVMECLDKYEIEIEDEKEDEDEKRNWRKNFEVYLLECKEAYRKFWKDEELIQIQQRLNPGVDIKLSIEKGYTNFWGTESGWKHKKKAKSKDIDWKSTIINSIGMNKVYIQREDKPRVDGYKFE